MAKIKLKAVMIATVEYEVAEGYDGCATISDLCRHEETAIRADPTEFCDAEGVKFTAKVTAVRPAKKP